MSFIEFRGIRDTLQLRRMRLLPLLTSAMFFLFLVSAPVVAEEAGEPPEKPAAKGASEAVTQRYLLWPLVSVKESSEWRELSVLPVYVEEKRKDESRKKVQFLWPLYLFRRDGKDITIRIFPLYTYWRDVYEYRTGPEFNIEYMLFPIVFGGSSTEAGGYFAVFPVGGELKHFLGRDEIHFILFPLYLSWEKGELRQRNYVWPVLSFSGGGGYSGFRIWPLYGFFEKENEFRSEFIAWPIYNHQKYDLAKEQPGERLLVFPFYAREESPRRSYRAVLWPFFTYEDNRARHFVERGMPWPFIVIARGDIERTQYWPLYGHREADDTATTFIAWPFWSRRISETSDGMQQREVRLLPVYDAKTRLSGEDAVLYHKVRAWPLWRFRRYEDGSTYFRSLALLWFDDEQGFERQYAPLWTLFERSTTPDGERRTYALWRLFQNVQTPGQTTTRIPLLFHYENDREHDSRKMQILGGLFGLDREENKRDIQVIYFIKIPG